MLSFIANLISFIERVREKKNFRSSSFWPGQIDIHSTFHNTEILKLFVNALEVSCDSILRGLLKQELDKLQRIQNTAARLINETKR